VKQVAEALGCHIMTIYGWVEEGKIPHMRIGRRVKLDGATLAVWLDKRTLN
jgi:excisionase family DNA binding protein